MFGVLRSMVLGSAKKGKNTFLEDAYSRFRETINPFPYRRYLTRHRLIFVHIPKCGGTTVLHTLAAGSRIYRDHATAEEFHNASPWKFQTYEKVGVIRDPVERALSTYRYIRAGGNQADDKALQDVLRAAGNSLTAFVDTFLFGPYFFTHRLFWPQVSFLSVHGFIAVPSLVPIHALDTYLCSLARQRGLDVSERRNASPSLSFDEAELAQCRDAIVERYHWDYEQLPLSRRQGAVSCEPDSGTNRGPRAG